MKSGCLRYQRRRHGAVSLQEADGGVIAADCFRRAITCLRLSAALMAITLLALSGPGITSSSPQLRRRARSSRSGGVERSSPAAESVAVFAQKLTQWRDPGGPSPACRAGDVADDGSYGQEWRGRVAAGAGSRLVHQGTVPARPGCSGGTAIMPALRAGEARLGGAVRSRGCAWWNWHLMRPATAPASVEDQLMLKHARRAGNTEETHFRSRRVVLRDH